MVPIGTPGSFRNPHRSGSPAISEAGGVVLLLVAHTWHEADGEEHIRIISARRATKLERKVYEQGT